MRLSAKNRTFTIGYTYDDTPIAGTEMFVPGASYPTERQLSESITLPTESDGVLIVPTGCHLDGWLERTDTGWKTTLIYQIAELEYGNFTLTPNWVVNVAFTYDGTEYEESEMFLPDAVIPTSYPLLSGLTLPGAEALVVPEGKTFAGWLLWDGESYLDEPITELDAAAVLTADGAVLTPKWDDLPTE